MANGNTPPMGGNSKGQNPQAPQSLPTKRTKAPSSSIVKGGYKQPMSCCGRCGNKTCTCASCK